MPGAPRFPSTTHRESPINATEVAKRISSHASSAELDCYRARDPAARGQLDDWTARARWAAVDFASGEALACCAACAAGRRASSGACSVDTDIDNAWLPPPRANTLIPDFVPDAPVAPAVSDVTSQSAGLMARLEGLGLGTGRTAPVSQNSTAG